MKTSNHSSSVQGEGGFIRQLVLFLTAVSLAQSALSAQLVPPAPVLGSEKDADGRPLPFGRQPIEPI